MSESSRDFMRWQMKMSLVFDWRNTSTVWHGFSKVTPTPKLNLWAFMNEKNASQRWRNSSEKKDAYAFVAAYTNARHVTQFCQWLVFVSTLPSSWTKMAIKQGMIIVIDYTVSECTGILRWLTIVFSLEQLIGNRAYTTFTSKYCTLVTEENRMVWKFKRDQLPSRAQGALGTTYPIFQQNEINVAIAAKKRRI